MTRRAVRRYTLALTTGALATTAMVGTVYAAPAPPADPTPPADPLLPTDSLPTDLRSALATPPANPFGKASGWVIGGDQGGRKVVVMDSRRRVWDSRARKWSWAPTAAKGFGDVAAGWGGVSDVRVRKYKRGTYVLAADSWGFIGAIAYPSGKRLWAVNAGRPNNVHAAELLPTGNVAVAASTRGWVRVYAASRGRAATTNAQVKLAGAHGVLWDPRRKVLWAIGDDHLVSLKVGGKRTAPKLTQVSRVALPSEGGHDLSPVYGNRNRLWITTDYGVYTYIKSKKRFAPARVNYPLVKAIGNHPSTGQVLLVRPKAGCATTWCTDTVELFGRQSQEAVRILPGAQFYKARWWASGYQ